MTDDDVASDGLAERAAANGVVERPSDGRAASAVPHHGSPGSTEAAAAGDREPQVAGGRRIAAAIAVVAVLLLAMLVWRAAPWSDDGGPASPSRAAGSTAPPPEAEGRPFFDARAVPFPTSRSVADWPFSVDSIWNRAIGSGAQFRTIGFEQPPNGYVVDTQVLALDPSAPLRPVVTFPWPARCAQASDADTGLRLPVPDDLVVSPEQPDWMGVTPNLAGAFVLPDGRTVQEVNYASRCEAAGPVAVAGDGVRGRLDLFGDGLGTSQGSWGGHGGSMLSALGGTIRLGELTGPEPIRHVTKIGLDCTRWCRMDGDANAFRWPALTADATSTVHYGSRATRDTTLAMGALLAIPPDVDLASLRLETYPAQKLAWAWQQYGAYVVENLGDDNGWGQQGIMAEFGVVAELQAVGVDAVSWSPSGWEDTAWNRDMNRLFSVLQQVVNQDADRVAGGGTPTQPLAPPLAEG